MIDPSPPTNGNGARQGAGPKKENAGSTYYALLAKSKAAFKRQLTPSEYLRLPRAYQQVIERLEQSTGSHGSREGLPNDPSQGYATGENGLSSSGQWLLLHPFGRAETRVPHG